MGVTREELRRQVYRAHARYIGGGKLKPVCPWCNRPVGDHWDAHEVIVKRSAVPVAKQHLIFVVENVLPVCHSCHTTSGQTNEFKSRAIRTLCQNLTAARVGRWYKSLWEKHELALPRGFLVPVKTITTATAIRHLLAGADLIGLDIRPTDVNSTAVGQAISAWRGHRARPESLRGIPQERLVEALSEGYWYTYIKEVTR